MPRTYAEVRSGDRHAVVVAEVLELGQCLLEQRDTAIDGNLAHETPVRHGRVRGLASRPAARIRSAAAPSLQRCAAPVGQAEADEGHTLEKRVAFERKALRAHVRSSVK